MNTNKSAPGVAAPEAERGRKQMVHKEYSKKITACIAIVLILAMIAAFAVFESRREPEKSWDTEFTIANTHVSWDQTFYGGPEVKP